MLLLVYFILHPLIAPHLSCHWLLLHIPVRCACIIYCFVPPLLHFIIYTSPEQSAPPLYTPECIAPPRICLLYNLLLGVAPLLYTSPVCIDHPRTCPVYHLLLCFAPLLYTPVFLHIHVCIIYCSSTLFCPSSAPPVCIAPPPTTTHRW